MRYGLRCNTTDSSSSNWCLLFFSMQTNHLKSHWEKTWSGTEGWANYRGPARWGNPRHGALATVNRSKRKCWKVWHEWGERSGSEWVSEWLEFKYWREWEGVLFDSAVIETNNLQGIIIKTQKDMVSHQFEKKTGLSLIEHNKKYLRILFNTYIICIEYWVFL